MSPSRLRRPLSIALGLGWVLALVMSAIHVLGLVSSPGLGVLVDRCPSSSLPFVRDLCAPVSVRVQLPREVPDAATSGAVELTGPVSVSLTVLNPTFEQRLAFEGPRLLVWLTLLGVASAFLWGVRAPRPEEDDPDHEEQEAPSPSRIDVALVAAGVLVALAGVGYVPLTRWTQTTLAEAGRLDALPAALPPETAALLPVVLGLSLAGLGLAERASRAQRTELAGLV